MMLMQLTELLWGRLLQQYRKWMKIQFNRRWQAGQQNLATDSWEEGYYRTFGRMMNQWIRGSIQLSAQWDNMIMRKEQH